MRLKFLPRKFSLSPFVVALVTLIVGVITLALLPVLMHITRT